MPTGVLVGSDELVAKALFTSYKQPPFKYERVLGLVDGERLMGAMVLHNWNGANIEFSYYAFKAFTLGVLRYVTRYIIDEFDPSRVTCMVSKKRRHLIKTLTRYGFRVEGVSRCYYGKQDNNRNAGVRLVLFREQLNRLAGLPEQDKKAA